VERLIRTENSREEKRTEKACKANIENIFKRGKEEKGGDVN